MNLFVVLTLVLFSPKGDAIKPIARRRESKVPRRAVCLKQYDFVGGTLIITEPGLYKLCEDIVFNPNAPAPGEVPKEDAFEPVFPGDYDENAFGLGFFSAIAIAASNVKLYLNGHTIEQSRGHALMQRFFSVIELADRPFIESAGPAQFVGDGDSVASATNLQIIGPGVIGRSSHHGIHGNENNYVVIKKVTFRDFEVAAVSLNNIDSLRIAGCTVERNRQDVPVVGLFSAARFIRPYGKALKDIGFSMDLRGVPTTAAALYDALIASIKNVYHDVIDGNGEIDRSTHLMEWQLFHNPFKAIDGPCYAFVVHGKGPAVGGYGEEFNENDPTTTSSRIDIRRNLIKNITCWTNEVPAAVEGHGTSEEVVTNDARGAVFQFVSSFNTADPYLSINPDGTYKGNVVADMQMMVAKAIQDGNLTNLPQLQTGINTISPQQVAWAQSRTAVYEPKYRCNGDSMHHVSKGIVAIRVEDTAGFFIKRNQIQNIVSLTPKPFSNCTDYHAGTSFENLEEQQGANIRAISIAAVRGFDHRPSVLKLNSIFNAKSENANVIIGIDCQGDSKDVEMKRNFVNLAEGVGKDPTDQYIACRVREQTTDIMAGIMRSPQEVQILNRRQLREEKKFVAHHHMSGDNEWKTGGCPFAHREL